MFGNEREAEVPEASRAPHVVLGAFAWKSSATNGGRAPCPAAAARKWHTCPGIQLAVGEAVPEPTYTGVRSRGTRGQGLPGPFDRRLLAIADSDACLLARGLMFVLHDTFLANHGIA